MPEWRPANAIMSTVIARTASAAVVIALGVAAAIGVARARQRLDERHDNTRATPVVSAPLESNSEARTAPHAADSTHQSTFPFEQLPAVTFRNRNSQQTLTAKLYHEAGGIDESAAMRLDAVLADVRDPKQPKTAPIDRRLLQLLYRAAYHFKAPCIEVTSAFRMPGRKREGLHALGRAIDFAIVGVKTDELASYLRKLPRVGVGLYTHRRTRFVHLDVREQSYHWLDASPPGRTWRGMSIGDSCLAARDAGYSTVDDWPEAAPIAANP